MAAVVPLEELTSRPDVEVRTVASVLLSNRKFVGGAAVFLVLLVVAVVGAQLAGSLPRGLGVPAIAVIIGCFAWAWPARAVRSQVLSLKERPFVHVGLLSGLSGWEIVTGELMPHLLPWLGANFINAFIAAILAESGLSILGLGPQQDVTLGVMIYWALSYGALLQNLWWWWATPVMTLIVVFLALYLVHV